MDISRRIADAERQRRIRIIDESFAEQSRKIQGLEDFITQGKHGDGGKLTAPKRPIGKLNRPRPRLTNLSDGLTGGLNARGRSLGGKISSSAINQYKGQTITVDATEVIVGQTSRNIGKQAGKKVVGRIVSGASVVGTIQTGWDIGTGIGGLGRGLLGIDDVNPYQDIPGFGAAELAWDLGDAINNAINDLIDPNSSGINSTADVIDPNPGDGQNLIALLNASVSSTTPSLLLDLSGLNANGERDETKPRLPNNSGGTVFYPYYRSGDYEYDRIVVQGSIYKGTTIWDSQYTFLPEQNSKGTVEHDYENLNWPTTKTVWRYRIVDLEGIEWAWSFNSSISSTSESGENFSSSGSSDNTFLDIACRIKAKKVFWWDDSSKDWVNENPKKDERNGRWQHFFGSATSYDTSFGEYAQYPYGGVFSQITNVYRFTWGTFYLSDPGKDEPLTTPETTPETTLRQVEKTNMKCLALDAVKALDARLQLLEEKLGKDKITSIKIETVDENGNKTTEEIDLDGVGGTVKKILENQYKEPNNEEILKRLGDPIDINTELPTGETLAIAGIGIGGLAGLALLSQQKLGKQITKLSTFNNAGTPTNIVPEVIEADAGGIGGGIDKINKELQEEKHDKAKKHKLELRTNLIALLDLALSIHNAFALSSSLIDTIVSFMNNVFQMLGFKDENDQPIDVKELIGETFQDLLKTLFGVETAAEITSFLIRSNRIVQTASNVLFDLQGLTDSVRSIGQQTGEYVAKIGNALRRNRIVPDDPQDSYQWMDEKMTATSAFQKRVESISEELNNVTDFMGSLESVTSEVISAQEQFGSLKNNAIEFKNLVITGENTKSEEEGIDTAESQAKGDMVVKPLTTDTTEEP